MILPHFYNSAAGAEHYLGLRWPKAVWRAVLEQAIQDVAEGPSDAEIASQRLVGRPARLAYELCIRRAARDWFEDEANEPRRFVWVCEQLDLNWVAVRAAVYARL